MEPSLSSAPTASIGPRLARGAVWAVCYRVIDRFAGIGSTIILARLLVPEDFGIVAFATSVTAIIELLGAFDFDTALIQRADASNEHFDTIWTLSLLRGVILGVITASLAWYAAEFYHEPRLVSVMLVLGLRQAILGLENVGVIAFRKDLLFFKEFRYLAAKRVATTVLLTLPMALVLRNYWALVGGNLGGAIIGVALSYAVHPYRPAFSLAQFSPLIGYSKWLVVRNFLEFCYERASDIILGRFAGSGALGSLAMARDVVSLVTREISAPVHRAALPGYAKANANRSEFRELYLNVFAVLILLIMPAAVGLCAIAQPVVSVLLGTEWLGTVPLIQILAFNALLNLFFSSAQYVNLAAGFSSSATLPFAAHVCISVPLMLWLVPAHGSHGIVIAMLVASITTTPLNFYFIKKVLEVRFRELCAIFWRPVIGSTIMWIGVVSVRGVWPQPVPLAGQIAYVTALSAIGVATYAMTVFGLWYCHKAPNSAEAWVITKLGAFRNGFLFKGRKLS